MNKISGDRIVADFPDKNLPACCSGNRAQTNCGVTQSLLAGDLFCDLVRYCREKLFIDWSHQPTRDARGMAL
jgi:hypothetical protein